MPRSRFGLRMRRGVAALLLLTLATSCATTRLPPISSAGAAFEPARDEVRLWERAREEERKLLDEAPLYQDPLLEDYLERVVQRLNPESMASNPEIGFRVTVLEDPTLNAFAYPHGSLYVHTGLLSRMENEDQLATVLGHEMTHVENRHMVRYRRAARNKQIGFGVAAIAAAVIVAGEQGDAYRDGRYGKAARIGIFSDLLVGLGLQLAMLASVNGYGRDLEREADDGAFGKIAAAGYDVRESPAVYRALLDGHGDSGQLEAFFFGSHPRLKERVENAENWLTEAREANVVASRHDPQEFQRRIRPVIRDDAELNIANGRLELAANQLDRVSAMMPDDPQVHYLRGLLSLRRADAETEFDRRFALQSEAAASLREAIRLDPERAAPHLELGLLAYATEDFETACVQFRQYVELEPRSDDTQRIRDYVLELERDGQCP